MQTGEGNRQDQSHTGREDTHKAVGVRPQYLEKKYRGLRAEEENQGGQKQNIAAFVGKFVKGKQRREEEALKSYVQGQPGGILIGLL